MAIRRRKVAGATAATAAPAPECNPGDTSDGERWSGNPDEEPEVPASAPANDGPRLRGQVAPKDRHPMPWGLVISDVFNLDVHKTFARLERELTLGDSATEYGTVLRAVDQSARNLWEAARLARRAKLEDENFAAELDKGLEELRSAAVAALEEEKAKGQRSKAPTLKDIEDRMLASWPDEVTSIKSRKAEMHGALRAIEALELAWRDRCQSLRVLAQQFNRAGA